MASNEHGIEGLEIAEKDLLERSWFRAMGAINSIAPTRPEEFVGGLVRRVLAGPSEVGRSGLGQAPKLPAILEGLFRAGLLPLGLGLRCATSGPSHCIQHGCDVRPLVRLRPELRQVALPKGTEIRPVTPETLNRELFGIRRRHLSFIVKPMSASIKHVPAN